MGIHNLKSLDCSKFQEAKSEKFLDKTRKFCQKKNL